MDEYGIVVLQGGVKRTWMNLLQCHFIHHKSHMKLPELNLRLCDEKPPSNHLRCVTVIALVIHYYPGNSATSSSINDGWNNTSALSTHLHAVMLN
jgi:hypothetical protein